MSERSESDRLQRESWLQRMLRRPEIGSFVVMIIIIIALAFASNGKAFNALGLKNNIAIIAQLGIIAVGAALLMIAGEFDLSIGPMIAFAGMSIAIMMKWGFPLVWVSDAVSGLFDHALYDLGLWLVDREYRGAIRPIQFYCDACLLVLLARFDRGLFPPD